MNKKTKNKVLGGFAITAVTGIMAPVIKDVKDVIKEKIMYNITLNDLAYTVTGGLSKYFKDLDDALYLNNDNVPDFRKNISYYNEYTRPTKSTIMWNGFPITLNVENYGSNSEYSRTLLSVSTINTPKAIANMKRFLNHCYHIQKCIEMKEASNNVWIYGSGRSDKMVMFNLTPFKKRTFENTFIPSAQELLIKESLDKFISNRQWYIDCNIPYHFGILLYSDPGTGKSTLVQAIADYINAELITFPGDRISELPQHIGTDICRDTCDPKSYRVVCVEDIDCGFAQSKYETSIDAYDDEKRYKRKVGLAEILNCIDGLQAPRNTIYIFTTNHIEKLDPALIRPGRCDLKIHIPSMTHEMFVKFCKYHFGDNAESHINKHYPSDRYNAKPLTFAEIQIDVMKGITLDELCKKVLEEK